MSSLQKNLRVEVQRVVEDVRMGAKRLEMMIDSLSSDEVVAIAEEIKGSTALLWVDLSSKGIDGGGAHAIAEAISLNGALRLEGVNLAGNAIGDDGARAIGGALGRGADVEMLDLKGNSIGPAGAQAIGKALAGGSSLVKLTLKENRIGDDGARALAEGLKGNKTLTKLGLRENQIGAQGARALAGVLAKTSLEILNLDWNQIGDDGASAMGAALAASTTITALHIEANQIGAAGAQAIGHSLKTNRSLTQLNFGRNKIGEGGAQALGEALRGSRSIKILDLNRCEIRSAGARSILSSGAPALTSLVLATNGIMDEDSLNPVLSAIPPSLTSLDARSNKLTRIPDSFLENGKNLNLTQADFSNNSWSEPPLEVVELGAQAIRDYLTKIRAEGKAYIATAKLMIVGVAEAGKTSLVNALIHGTSPVIAKDGRTVGIDQLRWVPDPALVRALTPPGKDFRELSVIACDFAGQKEYLVTHQLFMTRRAVYALVVDLSTPGFADKLHELVDPWLESVQSNTPGSRVVLIGTHADACSDDEVRIRCDLLGKRVAYLVAGMQRAFRDAPSRSSSGQSDRSLAVPIVHLLDKLNPTFAPDSIAVNANYASAVVAVSCMSGKGVDVARKRILEVMVQLDHVGFNAPQSYGLALTFAIEQRSRTYWEKPGTPVSASIAYAASSPLSLVGALQSPSSPGASAVASNLAEALSRLRFLSPIIHHKGKLYGAFCAWRNGREEVFKVSRSDFYSMLRFWHDIGEVYLFKDLVFLAPAQVFDLVRTIVQSEARLDDIAEATVRGDLKAGLRSLASSGRLSDEVKDHLFGLEERRFPRADWPVMVELLEHFGVLLPQRGQSSGWLVPALLDRLSVPPLDPPFLVRRITLPFAPFGLVAQLHALVQSSSMAIEDLTLSEELGAVHVCLGGKTVKGVYRREDRSVFCAAQGSGKIVGAENVCEASDSFVLAIQAQTRELVDLLLEQVVRLLDDQPGMLATLWVPIPPYECGVHGQSLHAKLGDPRSPLSKTAMVTCLNKAFQVPDLDLPAPTLTNWRNNLSGIGSPSSRAATYELLDPPKGSSKVPLLKLVSSLVDAASGAHKENRSIVTSDDHVHVDPAKGTASVIPVLAGILDLPAEIDRLKRLIAFTLLGGAWSTVESATLPALAAMLTASFWLEAADLVIATFTSLEQLKNHPLFWDEATRLTFFYDFGGEFCQTNKLDTLAVQEPVSRCASTFTVCGSSNWNDFEDGDFWKLLGKGARVFCDPVKHPMTFHMFLRQSRNIMQHIQNQLHDSIEEKNSVGKIILGLASQDPDVYEKLLRLVGDPSDQSPERWTTITKERVFEYLNCRRPILPPKFLQDNSLIILTYHFFLKLLSQPHPALNKVLRESFGKYHIGL
jgi:Ran GTPase-activating protein (RanGAP) involved in mRNA processing and transport